MGYLVNCLTKVNLLKLVNSKECPTLEKIIISCPYDLTQTFPQFPSWPIAGTITELTFNLKADLRSIQVEHVTSLRLVLDLSKIQTQTAPLQKDPKLHGQKLPRCRPLSCTKVAFKVSES